MTLYPQMNGQFNFVAFGCFAFLISFSILCSVSAQEETLVFHRLTTADGLSSQDDNYFIFQDSRGFIWISSASGLNRYDGNEIIPYLPEARDSNSLADPNLLSPFFEDAFDNLWFSSHTAFYKYRRQTDDFERHYIYRKDIPFTYNYRILQLDTANQNIWLSVSDSLFLYRPDETKERQKYLGKVSGNIRAQFLPIPGSKNYLLAEPRSGNLRIRIFEQGMKEMFPEAPLEVLTGYKINKILAKNGSEWWAATDRGLILFNLWNPQDFNIYSTFENTELVNINGIIKTHSGNLLVSTLDMGIYHFNTDQLIFDKKIYQYREDGNQPFEYRCDALYLDPDQNLWISSGGNGIYFSNLAKRKFNSLLDDQLVPKEARYVQSMAEDPFGRNWCLTKKGIVVLEANGKRSTDFEYLRESELPFYNSEPFHMSFDKDWNLWVCSQSGIYYLPNGKRSFTPVYKESGNEQDGFTFFRQLKSGRKFASSLASGLYEVLEEKGNIFLRLIPELGVPEGGYTIVWEDSRGKVYICRNFREILIFGQKDNRLIPRNEIEIAGGVWGFAEDLKNEIIWVAGDQGIWALDQENPVLAEKPELRFTDKFPRGILIDSQNLLWISTTRGLVRYDPESKTVRQFGMADGLQGLEFNFSSFLAMKDGRFAFGGMNGLNIFDPLPGTEMAIKAKPGITRILINQMPMPEDISCAQTGFTNITEIKKLDLDFHQRTLSFEFSSFDYSDPGSNQFQYQMHGVDDTLVLIGLTNSARYPNLRPGSYRFELQATNSDGVWSEDIAGIDILINPPWYQTWWARSLAMLIFAGLLYWLYRIRVRELEFRRKEAETKQLIAETETAVTRLQMNPHFIGNIMVSIQNCIMEKDMETAVGYLGRVNRMMRLLLNYAEKPYIEVGDEAEIIKSYLEVQQIRKDFEFDIHISDDVEKEEALIPTMILQPFVENSIDHGFQGNSRKWRMDINFWLADHSLFCSLQDNGVGRKESENDATKQKEFESKSTLITERRLSLIQPINGIKAGFQIEDLKNPSGTKVLLRFPLFDHIN